MGLEIEDSPHYRPSTHRSFRILVAQQNPIEGERLSVKLRKNGHAVHHNQIGSDVLRSFSGSELLILDIELSDIDGLELCREIRATSNIPIIIVTDQSTEIDRILAFQAGVDDVVTKPYSPRELLARIDAVMRRVLADHPGNGCIELGQLSLNPELREVVLLGNKIRTTRKEFDLLYLLARNHSSVIPRKRIMNHIWGDSWSQRTLDTHVNSLRNKLGDSNWIETVRGVGFKLGHGRPLLNENPSPVTE